MHEREAVIVSLRQCMHTHTALCTVSTSRVPPHACCLSFGLPVVLAW